MLRLGVAEYFDSVINEIDLYTETKIQSIKTQTEENWWNKRRREQIDEVRRIERACLGHVNALKVEEKEIESGEWMKRAFVEYCFTVNFDGLLYLAKANRYVEPREKRFLDVHLIKGHKNVNVAINSHLSLRMIIEEFEVNLRDYFLTDAPIIDISSGLNQCGRIKVAWISNDVDTKKRAICLDLAGLTIQECSLSFSVRNAGEEKEAVDLVKCLMARRDQLNTITIDLLYVDLDNPCQNMKALAQFIELDDPVKFNFRRFNFNFPEFDPSGFFEKHNGCSNPLVLVTNWQFISDATFDGVSLEDLEKADLSSLHSLKNLDLQFSSIEKSSSDWKFLDVCRASLEDLYMNCYEQIPLSLSCRTFSGMTKLKFLSFSGSFSVGTDSQELFADLTQLEILTIHSITIPFVLSRKRLSGMTKLKNLQLSGSFSLDTDSQEELFADLTQLEMLYIDSSECTTTFPLSRKMFCTMTNLQELHLKGAFSIEPNNQEELFADLIHLKKLDMSLDEQMLAIKWLIHSPTVEDLSLTFDKSPKVASSQIRFKLPKLASLQISFYCDKIDFDLRDMMSCFSHVKKLKIFSRCSDTMTKGWFHRLTSVEDLELDIEYEGHINSQLFEGFDHLTKLRIYIWPENIVDHCAFNKLVHLETISFVNHTDQDQPLDRKDKSFFDGLNSLRTIEYRNCNPPSRSYGYFENLDRFILIVT